MWKGTKRGDGKDMNLYVEIVGTSYGRFSCVHNYSVCARKGKVVCATILLIFFGKSRSGMLIIEVYPKVVLMIVICSRSYRNVKK